MQFQKSEIQSAIITTVITLLLLLFLCLFGMVAVRNEMTEGVEISFGEAQGLGEQMISPKPTTSPVATSTPVATPTPNPEDLLTQEDESVVMTEEERRKQKERNEQIAEEQRKADEERKKEEERKRAEEKRLETERINQERAETAKKMAGNAFANKGKGSGESSGATQQGNPAGMGKSPIGVTGLNGRSLLSNSGRLIEPPYTGNEQGRIVVDITVDADGHVISASVNVSKTTIGNEKLRSEAITAARKNRFSTAKGSAVARGTITFNYKIN